MRGRFKIVFGSGLILAYLPNLLLVYTAIHSEVHKATPVGPSRRLPTGYPFTPAGAASSDLCFDLVW